jgi:hypothetical protein
MKTNARADGLFSTIGSFLLGAAEGLALVFLVALL